MLLFGSNGRAREMQFRTANDIVLHYEHTGRGKPLIAWVNSLGTDYRIWDRTVASFLSDFSVLRYDKRGHGLSDVANPP
jgi:3-oxoadipate enol-lactonase